MARIHAPNTAWEGHHGSLQQANNEPIDPRPPELGRIEDIAATRGLPREQDLDELIDVRRPIEPAAAENPGEWVPGPNTAAANDAFGREAADEQEIGEATQQGTEQAVSQAGVDAIAFYLPITYYGPRGYGIYIRERRFYGFCKKVQTYAPNVPWTDVTASVLQFLLHHEAYHGAVELSCLASDDFNERRRARTYRTYFELSTGQWRHAGHGLFGHYRCPEEQLAQHAGFTNMPEGASGLAISGALIQISQTGPSDYIYDSAEWDKATPLL